MSSSTSHIARKRFGQNFLQDVSVIHQMVDALDLQVNERVIEIGPGLGALTLPLLARHKRLDVVEIDRNLAAHWQEYAQKQAPSRAESLVVHEMDALRFDVRSFVRSQNIQSVRMIGNLPYNISSPLLFHFLEHFDCIASQHFMLQKEVVDRMIAKAGDKDYGRLSVMLQTHYAMRCQQVVAPTCFEPAPKVWSAVVEMKPLATPLVEASLWPDFSRLVALAFSQRRKMLRGVLKAYMLQLDTVGIDGRLRAEDVSVEQFVLLAREVVKAKNSGGI